MIQWMFEHLPYEMAWCVITVFGYTPYVHFGLLISNYNIYLSIIMKKIWYICKTTITNIWHVQVSMLRSLKTFLVSVRNNSAQLLNNCR